MCVTCFWPMEKVPRKSPKGSGGFCSPTNWYPANIFGHDCFPFCKLMFLKVLDSQISRYYRTWSKLFLIGTAAPGIFCKSSLTTGCAQGWFFVLENIPLAQHGSDFFWHGTDHKGTAYEYFARHEIARQSTAQHWACLVLGILQISPMEQAHLRFQRIHIYLN